MPGVSRRAADSSATTGRRHQDRRCAEYHDRHDIAEIRLAHRTAEVHAGPAATHTRRRRSLIGLNVRWKKEAPLRSRGFFVVCGYAARRVSTRSTAFQRA
jgi:hypothetical protein